MTANLGSVYDIPASLRDDKSDVSTAATTKMMASSLSKDFRQTEGALYKPAATTFFSGQEQPV